jgi:hypothetical protein
VTSPAKGGGGGSIGILDVIGFLVLCGLRGARRKWAANSRDGRMSALF